jgi:hypothetical protein
MGIAVPIAAAESELFWNHPSIEQRPTAGHMLWLLPVMKSPAEILAI